MTDHAVALNNNATTYKNTHCLKIKSLDCRKLQFSNSVIGSDYDNVNDNNENDDQNEDNAQEENEVQEEPTNAATEEPADDRELTETPSPPPLQTP